MKAAPVTEDFGGTRSVLHPVLGTVVREEGINGTMGSLPSRSFRLLASIRLVVLCNAEVPSVTVGHVQSMSPLQLFLHV